MDDKTINSSEKYYARPYHDLHSPFSVDERGAFAEYIIHEPNKMPFLALGATIVIKDWREGNDVWIAGRVVGLKSISPFNPEKQSLLYYSDDKFDPTLPIEEINGPHTHQPMIIRVELTREMTDSEEKKRNFISSAIQRPPSAKSKLIFPNVTPVNDDPSPSLQEILDIRKNGLDLGMIGFGNKPYETNGNFLSYKWDIENLDNKHVFIVGESGSGKTVLLKNLAYQIRKHGKNQNNRIILTDVQGDISQLLLWDLDNIIQPKLAWQKIVAEKRESAEDAKSHLSPFQLVIPKIRKEEQDEDIVRLKRLATERGVRVKEISLRLQDLNNPSDVEYLYRISSPQAPGLLDDIAETLHNNQEKVTIERLDLALNRLLTRNTGTTITLTTNGLAYYRSTFEAARRALNNLKWYFDNDQTALQTNQNPLDAFAFEGTTILYLDHLNLDERLMWEMQLVKWLYDNKKSMNNTFVFFDEAHQIIPRTENSFGSPGVFDRLRSNFEKLAREGRKFGINLILSTQNPKDLHEIVPEQCPTRIVMKINPKNAKYAYLDDGLEFIANSFGQGQFWIQSPFNGTPDWIRVHSVAPPVPHEPMEPFRNHLKEKAKK
ncbi:MAG: ATP-binding protein [Chryseobacterium sp.]|jgi:DNA helicase HerA-like ATPase|uniref:ATP-binding protein n=1 Tax=Chryseobacterium sp. TaxID=1871047 RepID=UPI0028326889|nr:ATP-binding protein [Chryseobacterium sp.]MDR2238110.1 ATP-binding protein [Chryseobacterium sp.]